MRSSLFHGPCRSSLAIGTLAAIGFFAGEVSSAELAARPSATNREKATVAAEALVEEALTREIYGLDEDRDALLAKAEALAPDLPTAKWHRGLILIDGKWSKAEEVAAEARGNGLLAEYGARRDAAENTFRDHLALADWCAKHGLAAQEQAHLARVLTFDPDHANARARLGFVRVEDEWIGREQIARAFAEEIKAQASLAKYRGDFQDLARHLSDEKQVVRERAEAAIRAIRDVSAIPALEIVIAGESEKASFLVLDVLSNIPEKEAALSLARFAVLSPSYQVRDEAAESLRRRKPDHYVPAMIATMRMPLRTETLLERRFDDMRLVCRQVYIREGRRSTETVIHDVVYENSQISAHPIAQNGVSDDRRITNAAQLDYATRSTAIAVSAAFENAPDIELNALVGAALSKATGQRPNSDPRDWWEWWDRQNEMTPAIEKPNQVRYSRQSFRTPAVEERPERLRITRASQRQVSCFPAGTPVLTNRGDVAIEQVRVGDLVLAQDVESGELAFKPVLDTTIREPAEILRVEHEQGSFRCTGGHPFWVAGEGWVHAKNLKSGMELHALDGSVRVSEVESDGAEPTYNLIVDDFANYFADEARILSHDNSSRRPTDAIVPGLVQD